MIPLSVILVVLMVRNVALQEQDDAENINPEICGMTYQKASNLLRQRRFTSSSVADQRQWGWQAILLNEDNTMSCGSLINSQWVLSYANDNE
jgi:hypothetical protein